MVVLDLILCATGNGTTRRCTGQAGVTVSALNVLVKVTEAMWRHSSAWAIEGGGTVIVTFNFPCERTEGDSVPR